MIQPWSRQSSPNTLRQSDNPTHSRNFSFRQLSPDGRFFPSSAGWKKNYPPRWNMTQEASHRSVLIRLCTRTKVTNTPPVSNAVQSLKTEGNNNTCATQDGDDCRLTRDRVFTVTRTRLKIKPLGQVSWLIFFFLPFELRIQFWPTTPFVCIF